MKALVTGGGGFLGSAIVARLVERGDLVASFSRRRYPELEALGVTCHLGDLADAEAVSRAVGGNEMVFHVAAMAGIWGSRESFYRANVQGTENVIAACVRHGIGRLVHTSSPSVVFDGRDMEGVDESVPYPRHYKAHYPETKALAEMRVLEAADRSLATVALRPHLIWGPRDNHLVPRILARARAGRLRRIGSRNPRVDSTYIDNAAAAHLLAADCLEPLSKVSGRAYFISNGEPMPIWDLVNAILDAADLPPVEKGVPESLARFAGGLLEGIYGALRLESEPPMTRFVAAELSTAHWFDLRAAREDLDFEPEVSIEQGLERLAAWLRSEARGNVH